MAIWRNENPNSINVSIMNKILYGFCVNHYQKRKPCDPSLLSQVFLVMHEAKN